ncbi:unnamed protein product [Notodromas monacha]|uniref:Kinesin-like protein n=1 Tax=Notodromas monacha TaxID=399045 RepID=A0A7R9G8U5_9CRUS|nr:unnamed protein product [Notodromas monacha]CAG0913640.1 unnamed protein product [Notodromas monacha]
MALIRRSVNSKAGRTRLLCSPLRSKKASVLVGAARKRRSFQATIVRTPKAKSTSSYVKVAVRVRPRNDRESGNETAKTVVKPFQNCILFDPDVEDEKVFFHNGRMRQVPSAARKRHQNITYSYDHVFSESDTNSEVFSQTMTEVIEKVLEGYNGSVFAYGATGAGKTHTMLGRGNDPGITFLTAAELFRRTQERSTMSAEFQVSYLEVYNELVYDLIESERVPLQILDDGQVVSVKGLSWHTPKTPDELLDMLVKGNENRSQSGTVVNKDSSRSHAVFTIQLIQRELVSEEGMECMEMPRSRYSKLVLVDLAGSERAAATASTGARFKEGTNINKSLLALGRCINDLVEGKGHVNYRGSKLTRLLKDCLGGNCRTVMLAAVSPTSLQFGDTKNTLEYASRARKITCSLKQNVRTVTQSTAECLKVISELTADLAQSRRQNAELEAELAQVREERNIARAERDACKVALANQSENSSISMFEDQLVPLEEAFRTQRMLDVQLHEVFLEKSSGHFRLERAKVVESQLDYMRLLTDERKRKQDFSRLRTQIDQILSRVGVKEQELRFAMQENANSITSAIDAIKTRVESMQGPFAKKDKTPLVLRLVEGIQAKFAAQAANATERHYKFLLSEAERELCHYQRLSTSSFQLLKRSCLLAQASGRDAAIANLINSLYDIVFRRDGIHFDDELRPVEQNGDVAILPNNILLSFGQDSDGVRGFIPPFPSSPAALFKQVDVEVEEVEEPVSSTTVCLKPEMKEKWIKVTDQSDSEAMERVEGSVADLPDDVSVDEFKGEWSNLVSSTPFVRPTKPAQEPLRLYGQR